MKEAPIQLTHYLAFTFIGISISIFSTTISPFEKNWLSKLTHSIFYLGFYFKYQWIFCSSRNFTY